MDQGDHFLDAAEVLAVLDGSVVAVIAPHRTAPQEYCADRSPPPIDRAEGDKTPEIDLQPTTDSCTKWATAVFNLLRGARACPAPGDGADLPPSPSFEGLVPAVHRHPSSPLRGHASSRPTEMARGELSLSPLTRVPPGSPFAMMERESSSGTHRVRMREARGRWRGCSFVPSLLEPHRVKKVDLMQIKFT